MKVKINKDWAGNKKGAVVNIRDWSVIDKGFAVGLFEGDKPKRPEKIKASK
jgi:hypothetical protein